MKVPTDPLYGSDQLIVHIVSQSAAPNHIRGTAGSLKNPFFISQSNKYSLFHIKGIIGDYQIYISSKQGNKGNKGGRKKKNKK